MQPLKLIILSSVTFMQHYKFIFKSTCHFWSLMQLMYVRGNISLLNLTPLGAGGSIMNDLQEYDEAVSQSSIDFVSVLKNIRNFNQGVIKGYFSPEQLNEMLEEMIKEVGDETQKLQR